MVDWDLLACLSAVATRLVYRSYQLVAIVDAGAVHGEHVGEGSEERFLPCSCTHREADRAALGPRCRRRLSFLDCFFSSSGTRTRELSLPTSSLLFCLRLPSTPCCRRPHRRQGLARSLTPAPAIASAWARSPPRLPSRDAGSISDA